MQTREMKGKAKDRVGQFEVLNSVNIGVVRADEER